MLACYGIYKNLLHNTLTAFLVGSLTTIVSLALYKYQARLQKRIGQHGFAVTLTIAIIAFCCMLAIGFHWPLAMALSILIWLFHLTTELDEEVLSPDDQNGYSNWLGVVVFVLGIIIMPLTTGLPALTTAIVVAFVVWLAYRHDTFRQQEGPCWKSIEQFWKCWSQTAVFSSVALITFISLFTWRHLF